jgi:pimeloyl-ACP methyl ester carboxylesterase
MTQPAPSRPTIVHGAFADSSGWHEPIKRLQAEGLTAIAVANPLRGLHSDADYVRAFLDTVDGPIVLVGHSYGGAVITNAATGNDRVLALVYINAFALDEGETVSSAIELGGGSSDLVQHVQPRPFPGAGGGDADAYLDPANYHELFCQDLPAADAASLAATQRPAALATLGAPSGVPAWRSIQSWYLVSSSDRIIPPEAERFMAERAEAHTVEIESSHVAMMSHPDAVAKLVLDAVKVSAPSR